MYKILITGGAGFIGSHIVDLFIEKGYEVFVIDDLSTGKKENINSRAIFYQTDILDKGLSEIVAKINPQTVMHLAAQVDVRKSQNDPLSDVKINVWGLLKLLEALKSTQLKKFIFASSGGAVYGNPLYLPIKETHPKKPLSIYGISKLMSEHIIANYARKHTFQHVLLRMPNVYGPRQDVSGDSGVVAIFINQILAGKTPRIFGDGSQTRDFIYVADVVDSFLKAFESDISGAFNTGTGIETSINLLYNIISELLGFHQKPFYDKPKEGDVKRNSLDITKFRKRCGFVPRYSLKKGLEETVNYFKSLQKE